MSAGGNTDAVCIAVAYSGGRDSTALLHATAMAARDWPNVSVVALHVHHGLSPFADHWLRHAQATCEAWAMQGLPVSLRFQHVVLPVRAGDSVESVARTARRAALQEMARAASATMLLLAHHRQDQAETLLLQAMRGGSVAGLAGMPGDVVRDGVRWVRPWLAHPRSAIEAYVAAHNLQHIEDDSNADPRYARNRLRLSVWPALVAAFPEAEANLAASARRLSDALAVITAWREQAIPPLLASAPEPGGDSVPPREAACTGLDVTRWAVLPAPLRREALRAWYSAQAGGAMHASWVERLAQEVPEVMSRRGVARWEGVGLSLYRGVLHFRAAGLEAAPHGVVCADVPLRVMGPGDWRAAAWRGCLRVREVQSGGVPVAMLHHLVLRPRTGGERFQMGAGRPPRSLKKQFQAAGVPAWMRDGPLVFAGKQLVYVPGLGIDARSQAGAGAIQFMLSWHADPISA